MARVATSIACTARERGWSEGENGTFYSKQGILKSYKKPRSNYTLVRNPKYKKSRPKAAFSFRPSHLTGDQLRLGLQVGRGERCWRSRLILRGHGGEHLLRLLGCIGIQRTCRCRRGASRF